MATASSNGASSPLLHNLILFGRVLRKLGLNVHAGRMLLVVDALNHIEIGRKQDFYHALRTTLVHRPQDLSLFDEAFQVFWRRPTSEWTTMDLRSLGEQRRFRQPQVGPPPPGPEPSQETSETRPGEEVDRVDLTKTFSAREVLREKEFSTFTGEEIVQAKEMLAQLRWDAGMRRSRRWVSGRGPMFDLRRTLRWNSGRSGELVELRRRQRKHKRRPLVLICDVSGSMERYTRMLLHFIHSVHGELEQVEAFLFATRLTRITRHLAHRRIDQAVTQVSRAVPDWAGGTRIGETLKAFNFYWARRVLGHGAVVLIISDGWDTGDPMLLQREMARLHRSCHWLIWLNPLLGLPTYQPLTRGMQVARPFIDDFLPVHNLASLNELAQRLNMLPARHFARVQQVTAPSTELAAQTIDASPPSEPSPYAQANPTFRHPLWGSKTR